MRSHRLIVLSVAALLAGCSSYYRVDDTATGESYYTTEVEDRRSGAVQFKDAANGSRVTLQNSRVVEVTREEYETNRSGQRGPVTRPSHY